MPPTEPSPLLSRPLTDPVQTYADVETPSPRSVSPEIANREAWQDLIDHKLIDWGWNTAQFEDDGIEPPTRVSVQVAIVAAGKYRDAEKPAPDSVVPDADGGITFERREGKISEVIHVWDDGTIEYYLFHGTKLEERVPL